ncbi:hypothetical protein YOLOSWAG_288 [Erwinia phage vB_EamM_Yoloswag]|uniref:Uncharacterized protein n=1 Tax=Erwinia phage vB_EamM_Yoloswag TaxID=1958956 RepID=A0A1S6L3M9_9CAUD|nr:hypothetical protein HOR66_gp288 [Erwinia phage vB_EamM_Yoloswag]AQT28759.1 hypothetical protein YOLOSWAG_288 [Erwinia phage vB_EamM_Yoloswag]
MTKLNEQGIQRLKEMIDQLRTKTAGAKTLYDTVDLGFARPSVTVFEIVQGSYCLDLMLSESALCAIDETLVPELLDLAADCSVGLFLTCAAELAERARALHKHIFMARSYHTFAYLHGAGLLYTVVIFSDKGRYLSAMSLFGQVEGPAQYVEGWNIPAPKSLAEIDQTSPEEIAKRFKIRRDDVISVTGDADTVTIKLARQALTKRAKFWSKQR